MIEVETGAAGSPGSGLTSLLDLYPYATREYEGDARNMLDSVLKEVLDPACTVQVTPRIVQDSATAVLSPVNERLDERL